MSCVTYYELPNVIVVHIGPAYDYFDFFVLGDLETVVQ